MLKMRLHNMSFVLTFAHPTHGTNCTVYRTDEGFFYTDSLDNEQEFHYICSLDKDVRMSLSERFY